MRNVDEISASIAFDEAIYRAWNPDVDAAIRSGTLASGRVHFETFGRREQRLPYFVATPCCGAPPFRAGDELVQRVVPAEDWWAAVSFTVGTHRSVARLVINVRISDEATGELRREIRFEEWAGDGEALYLKFPPIEQSRQIAFVVHLHIAAVDCGQPIQLHCEPADAPDGLIWNGAARAAVRARMELLYTPLTVPGPRGITLNPLTFCPANCIHCLSRVHRENPGALQSEWIAALRSHFHDGPGEAWCIDYATDFFYVAERRPELFDLIGRGVVSINTDGQRVTAAGLRRVMAVDLAKIGFSCDAATEETYAFVRRGLGRLQTVLAAARLAVAVRAESGRDAKPRLALSMVTMKANVHEMVGLVDLAADVGVDEVWFNQLWVVSADMVEQSLMFAPELWRSHWTAAEQRGREVGIRVYTGPDVRPHQQQRGISWCPEPWSALLVLGNGDVLSCASPAARIGSLRESTLEAIWNGEPFQELRRRVNSDHPPLMCEHCFVYRKPGHADGVFMHHLLDDYDLRRDLADPGYAHTFRERFSFARCHPHPGA